MRTNSETSRDALHPSSVYPEFTDEARALLDSYVPVGVHPLVTDLEEIRSNQKSLIAMGGVLVVVDLRPIMESEWGKPTVAVVDELREWFENGREDWCTKHLPGVLQSERPYVLLFTAIPLNLLNDVQRSSPHCKTILQMLTERDSKSA